MPINIHSYPLYQLPTLLPATGAQQMATAANFDQGYKVIAEGDQKVATFRCDGLPWSGCIMFPIFYMIAIGFLFSPLWPVSIVAGCTIRYLIYLMYQTQCFILAPDGIIKKGVKYEADRISEIIVDNPMDQDTIYNAQPGMFVGGTGIAGASVEAMSFGANLATDTMVHASQAISRSAAKRRNRVRIRYGSTVLCILSVSCDFHAHYCDSNRAVVGKGDIN